jgi:histidinol phosphatase-like PHP family hydrolase
MAVAGAQANLTAVLFSEHVRHTSTYFPEFVDDIRRLAIPELAVWVGVEAKVLDLEGRLDCSPAVAQDCDAIIGSVHVPLATAASKWSELSAEAAVALEFQMAMAIVCRSQAHILGHPMGMVIARFGQKPLAEIRALAEACRDNDKAFELNARYCADLKFWIDTVTQVGCPVSLGSDAHRPADVGRAWQMFVQEA